MLKPYFEQCKLPAILRTDLGEIEGVILEHISILETAVLGQEDEILGEAIKAFVVLKPGKQLSKKDLILHCRRNLPPFKVPQNFVFLDELPKTSTGKTIKAELKSL